MKTQKDLKEFPLSWKRIFMSQQGHLIFQKDFALYDNQGNLLQDEKYIKHPSRK